MEKSISPSKTKGEALFSTGTRGPAWSCLFRRCFDGRAILRRHECKTRYPYTERVRHLRELRMVREVGLEEVLGLGNASDFRGGRVRGMQDLSFLVRPRWPRQGGGRLHLG